MLDFPAHTSDYFQPLNVAVYGPLKDEIGIAYYEFLISNPGRVITIGDVAGIFKVVYRRVATKTNGVVVFELTGIESFNSQLFQDEMFEPAAATNRPL